MSNADFEGLFHRSKALELKDNIFEIREVDLGSKIEKQNSVFEKLRKGYESLGHTIGSETEVKDLEHLRDSLSEMVQLFSEINQNSEGDKFDHIKEKEKLVIKMVEQTVLRWNNLSEARNKWRLERLVIQSQEKALLEDEYVKLKTLPKEKFLYQERAEIIYKMHDHLLKEQEQIIDDEELALQELEEIYKIRKQLYETAVSLFEA